MPRFEDRDPNILTDYHLNQEVYGEDDVSDLAESIKIHGVEPLKVTPDNVTISGSRRRRAAIEAGLTKVPCQIINETDEHELKRLWLRENDHRKKTNEMRAREYELWKEIEAEDARCASAPARGTESRLQGPFV